MQVVDCRCDLANDSGCFLLADPLLFRALVERPAVHVLQNDIEVRLVVEAAVHLKDVGMFKAALDADLECELVDHHICLD